MSMIPKVNASFGGETVEFMESKSMTIGDRINHLRKQKGITQKQLAELIGVTEASVSTIVNGSRKPRADSIVKLADALCVTTDYLLKGKSMGDYIMECIRCLGIKFVVEDDIIKVKWRHGDKHYIVPFGGLLELWEIYEEQDHE